MDRYFKVNQLATDVRNTKAQLDDLGKRLMTLKSSVLAYSGDVYDVQPIANKDRTELASRNSLRFTFDSEMKNRRLDRKRRTKVKIKLPAEAVVQPEPDVTVDLDSLKAKITELRQKFGISSVAFKPSPAKATQSEPKGTKVRVFRRKVTFEKPPKRDMRPKRTVTAASRGTRQGCTACSEPQQSPIAASAPPKRVVPRVPLRIRQNVADKPSEPITFNKTRVVHVPIPDMYRIRRKYELPQNSIPQVKDASAQKKIIDYMREKYFGNMGTNCVYRIIDGDVPQVAKSLNVQPETKKSTRVAAVQTTCEMHSDLAAAHKTADTATQLPASNGQVDSSGRLSSRSNNQTSAEEALASSKSSVMVDLKASPTNEAGKVQKENSVTTASEVATELSSGRSTLSPSTVKSTPLTTGRSDPPAPICDTEDDLNSWREVRLKSISSLYQVKISLLEMQRAAIDANESKGLFYEERIENLQRQMKEDIHACQQQTVRSVADEVKAIGELQRQTALYQKQMAQMYELDRNQNVSIKSGSRRPARKRKSLKKRDSMDTSKYTPTGSSGSTSDVNSSANGNQRSPLRSTAKMGVEEPIPVSGRSEYKANIETLKNELQVRKEVARKLNFEYAQRSKEQFKNHEQSLQKQIQNYDNAISKTEQQIADLTSVSQVVVPTHPPPLVSNLDELLKSPNNSSRSSVGSSEEPAESSESSVILDLQSTNMADDKTVDQTAQRLVFNLLSDAVCEIQNSPEPAVPTEHSPTTDFAQRPSVSMTFDLFDVERPFLRVHKQLNESGLPKHD